MPPEVRKAGSLVSLSVIATGLVTSISLTMIYFFGDSVMQARETRIEVPYIIKSIEHMSNEFASTNAKIDHLLNEAHSNRMELAKHQLRLEYCESRMDNCEKQHRKYHHEMNGE